MIRELTKFTSGIMIIMIIPGFILWLLYLFSRLFEGSLVFEILVGFFAAVVIIVYFFLIVGAQQIKLSEDKQTTQRLRLIEAITKSPEMMEKYPNFLELLEEKSK